jgi:NAD+--dinitrogen-reductase ADP-D-ribosyltransferase
MASIVPASADPASAAWYLRHSALLNRCNLSAWTIASQSFQDEPQELEILGVGREHGGLFAVLAGIDAAEERAALFHEHALRCFWLYEDPAAWPSEAQRRRYSYAGILRGWGVDSNGPAGAVFKGWAENRFGLRAIYHGGRLSVAAHGDRYASERMRGAITGIGVQLDVLYAYCQHELRRRHRDTQWLTLYRGTHDPEAYTVKEAVGLGRDRLVEFNTVSSFTADREVAWEFGSAVWKVQVPLAKIVYFSGLLAGNLLQGEQEYIVLGGDYLVTPLVH